MSLAAAATPGPGAETIYAVTNTSGATLTLQHVFTDGSGFTYTFTSQVAPGSTSQYHVAQMPQIPSPFTGNLSLHGDQSFTAQVVGYDYPATSLTPTATASVTATSTPTAVPSTTATSTPTATPSTTATATPTSTPAAGPTATATATPAGATVQTQTLALTAGWHLVSYSVLPSSTAVRTVLASLGPSVDLVYGFDPTSGGATSYFTDPSKAAFDTLANLLPLHGYWLHLTAPATWTISGTPLPSSQALTLAPGWNLVGYAGPTSAPVSTVLAPLGGTVDLVYGFDPATGGATSYFTDPSKAAFDTLTTFAPQQGYWLHFTGTTPKLWSGS